MVLINAGRRRKTARTTSVHLRQRRSDYIKLVFGFLIAVSVAAILGLVSLLGGTTKSSLLRMSPTSIIAKKDQQLYFDQHNKEHDVAADPAASVDHPDLHLENVDLAEPSDFFDTAATDILQTLSCHALLASHSRLEINSRLVYGLAPPPNLENADQQGHAAGNEWQNVVPENPNVARFRRLNENAGASADAAAMENKEPSLVRRIGLADRENTDDSDDAMGHEALVTGAHLFCLAAFPTTTTTTTTTTANDNKKNDETAYWHDLLQCPVRTDRTVQRAILELWSTARTELLDATILKQTLSFATEQVTALVGTDLHLWTAPDDIGLLYTAKILNEQVENQRLGRYGGLAGLAETLGPGRLYVDIGSGLGLTAMAVALLYPGTEIVSIEAAPTNWLLQEMNWRCNNFDVSSSVSSSRQQRPDSDAATLERPQVHLAGIGISSGSASQLAKFLWRPTATTSTRAWGLSVEEEKTNLNDIGLEDIEVPIKLRPWHLIESEADIKGRDIDVLNLDCEGCEYNIIPALSEMDFEAIRVVLGQVHWGDIPTMKLPSSQRAQTTHKRLCRHENFARSSIECCAFPDVTVQSSFSGEVLVVDSEQFPPVSSTVKDVAGTLCQGFAEWAQVHNLFNVESDWGWLQSSSMKEK
jgi:hypothetical protein